MQVGAEDIDVSAQAERYGMTLRNVLFAALNGAFQTPRVVTLLVGAYGYQPGLGRPGPDHHRRAVRRGAGRARSTG